MKPLAALLALTTVVATPALAGPPWISIETRPMGDAVAWARTFHHGTPMPMALRGTAEGLVNGQRRSVALRFDTTAEANAFAIPRTWGENGVWVLNMETAENEHMGAGASVGIDRSGNVAFVRFARNYNGVSRKASPGEVDAMLRALEEGRQPPAMRAASVVGALRVFAPLGVLALLVLAVAKLAGRALERWRGRAAAAA